MKVSGRFLKENYAGRLVIVENFSCLIFGDILSKIYIKEYLKQFSTQRFDIVFLTSFLV